MADFKVTIKTQQLETIVQRAIDESVQDLDQNFSTAITDDIWPWPYGESPRDIVDTGDLRDSQTLTKGDMDFIWRWPVKYSIYVLLGTSKMPGRDWIGKGLRDSQPFNTFVNKIKNKLN